MRGTDHQQSHMFSYLSPEARVRKDHPLRLMRTMVDEVLRALSPQFDGMYASEGRPSIAPEKLLRAQLLQMLYSIRSELSADGRDRLQRAVSLVRRIEFGRGSVGPDGVQQEPAPAIGSRGGQAVLGAGGGTAEGLRSIRESGNPDLRFSNRRNFSACSPSWQGAFSSRKK
jgi:hypothetical protein